MLYDQYIIHVLINLSIFHLLSAWPDIYSAHEFPVSVNSDLRMTINHYLIERKYIHIRLNAPYHWKVLIVVLIWAQMYIYITRIIQLRWECRRLQHISKNNLNWMKNKRYHTVATVSIEKSLIQDRSLSWLGKGTSINSGGVKLTFWGDSNLSLSWNNGTMNVVFTCE